MALSCSDFVMITLADPLADRVLVDLRVIWWYPSSNRELRAIDLSRNNQRTGYVHQRPTPMQTGRLGSPGTSRPNPILAASATCPSHDTDDDP